MKKLTVGSCFSGIGGLELGLEWTGGFETKWQIEFDPYASRVLAKHWPNVKRYSDIRDVVRPEPVDLICGGFPCQDVSLAGKRAGLEGKRSTLWSEMFRLICEVKPRWIVAENVPGLLSSDAGRFFGNILRDLASAGYDVEWGMLSAAGVGAPHRRQRIFILAHTQSLDVGNGLDIGRGNFDIAPESGQWGIDRNRSDCGGDITTETDENVADPNGFDVGLARTSESRHGEGVPGGRHCGWGIEPDVGRMADGVPDRAYRLKCLGNAVVPQVAQKIGEMILESNSSLTNDKVSDSKGG